MGRASGSSRWVSLLANAHLKKKVLMWGRWALSSFLAACQISDKGPGADRYPFRLLLQKAVFDAQGLSRGEERVRCSQEMRAAIDFVCTGAQLWDAVAPSPKAVVLRGCCCPGQARRVGHSSASTSGMDPAAAAAAEGAPQGVWQAVTGGFREELAALKEGAVYISAPKNRSAIFSAVVKFPSFSLCSSPQGT